MTDKATSLWLAETNQFIVKFLSPNCMKVHAIKKLESLSTEVLFFVNFIWACQSEHGAIYFCLSTVLSPCIWSHLNIKYFTFHLSELKTN